MAERMTEPAEHDEQNTDDQMTEPLNMMSNRLMTKCLSIANLK